VRSSTEAIVIEAKPATIVVYMMFSARSEDSIGFLSERVDAEF
jgi:hypothetical protein